MVLPAPTYDLMMLLDSSIEEDRRQTILGGVEDLILDRGGEIVERQEWGVRALAFEIDKRPDAEYQLLQFLANRELLEQLHRTLRITDGVVRFRIIKLRPGTQAAPEQRPRAGAGADA
ncbi:MAG: 30S ribosomal protein S6 [Solirubrobacterales bacterium]|nr:30S ribosomal protein S6 [Solirubrobacterales bacterium]